LLLQVKLIKSVEKVRGYCMLPKLPAPLADGFIRDDDTTGNQQFFNIAVAQAETAVQPDTVADDR
jgi:hypothetical protein